MFLLLAFLLQLALWFLDDDLFEPSRYDMPFLRPLFLPIAIPSDFIAMHLHTTGGSSRGPSFDQRQLEQAVLRYKLYCYKEAQTLEASVLDAIQAGSFSPDWRSFLRWRLINSKSPSEPRLVAKIPVIFVHGHRGFFRQARNWGYQTFRQDALHLSAIHQSAPFLSFDLFTLDLDDALPIFSSELFLDQVAYAALCINFILEKFYPENGVHKQAILIGTSLGAFVCNYIIHCPQYRSISAKVKTFISLAGLLHANRLPLIPTFNQLYAKVSAWSQVAPLSVDFRDGDSTSCKDFRPFIISICSGLRDIQVPMQYSLIHDSSHSILVQMNEIPFVWSSMDHNSIIWSHAISRRVVYFLSYDIEVPQDHRYGYWKTALKDQLLLNSASLHDAYAIHLREHVKPINLNQNPSINLASMSAAEDFVIYQYMAARDTCITLYTSGLVFGKNFFLIPFLGADVANDSANYFNSSGLRQVEFHPWKSHKLSLKYGFNSNFHEFLTEFTICGNFFIIFCPSEDRASEFPLSFIHRTEGTTLKQHEFVRLMMGQFGKEFLSSTYANDEEFTEVYEPSELARVKAFETPFSHRSRAFFVLTSDSELQTRQTLNIPVTNISWANLVFAPYFLRFFEISSSKLQARISGMDPRYMGIILPDINRLGLAEDSFHDLEYVLHIRSQSFSKKFYCPSRSLILSMFNGELSHQHNETWTLTYIFPLGAPDFNAMPISLSLPAVFVFILHHHFFVLFLALPVVIFFLFFILSCMSSEDELPTYSTLAALILGFSVVSTLSNGGLVVSLCSWLLLWSFMGIYVLLLLPLSIVLGKFINRLFGRATYLNPGKFCWGIMISVMALNFLGILPVDVVPIVLFGQFWLKSATFICTTGIYHKKAVQGMLFTCLSFLIALSYAPTLIGNLCSFHTHENAGDTSFHLAKMLPFVYLSVSAFHFFPISLSFISTKWKFASFSGVLLDLLWLYFLPNNPTGDKCIDFFFSARDRITGPYSALIAVLFHIDSYLSTLSYSIFSK